MTVFFCKLNKGSQLFFVRRSMNTIWKRNGLFLDLDFCNVRSNRSVCQQHEFFNELMRLPAFFDHDTNRLSFFIEFKPDFYRRKIDGSFFYSLFSESLG